MTFSYFTFLFSIPFIFSFLSFIQNIEAFYSTSLSIALILQYKYTICDSVVLLRIKRNFLGKWRPMCDSKCILILATRRKDYLYIITRSRQLQFMLISSIYKHNKMTKDILRIFVYILC